VLPYDKKALRLYVNAKEEGSGNFTKNPEMNAVLLRIGNGIDGLSMNSKF